VGAGGDGEAPEEEGPDDEEEEDDEQGNGPGGGVLAGPEVFPVAAVGRGEEVVLDDDGDEEPLDGRDGLLVLVRKGGRGEGRGGAGRAYQDDFSADDGAVEGGDAAGGLAVVVWETEEEHEPDGPEEDGKGSCDAGQCRAVRYQGRRLDVIEIQLVEA